jgi:hypothetical protein
MRDPIIEDHVAAGWDEGHSFRWIEVGRLRLEEDDKGATVLARTVVPARAPDGDPTALVELYGPTWLSATELAGLSRQLVDWFCDDLADKIDEIEKRTKAVKRELDGWNDRARIDEEHPPYADLSRSLDAILARCRDLREAPALAPGAPR